MKIFKNLNRLLKVSNNKFLKKKIKKTKKMNKKLNKKYNNNNLIIILW